MIILSESECEKFYKDFCDIFYKYLAEMYIQRIAEVIYCNG